MKVGCILSKTLLVDSERRDGRAVDLRRAVARKDLLVARLRKEKYSDLLDEYGIDFRAGGAELLDGHTVAVDGASISAEAILVAPAPALPFRRYRGVEQAGYLTSTTAMEVSDPPADSR